jgi:hypothetical protein
VTDGDLLGKAQSLLEALREKGLHLPNPTRVDGDTDAIAALAEEVRAHAALEDVSVAARFDASGALHVEVGGAQRERACFVEVRAFAPWREEPRTMRMPFVATGAAEVIVDGVERDGPVNVVLVDVGGCPLAWCTARAG